VLRTLPEIGKIDRRRVTPPKVPDPDDERRAASGEIGEKAEKASIQISQ